MILATPGVSGAVGLPFLPPALRGVVAVEPAGEDAEEEPEEGLLTAGP
jgi:hypothetical protein